jgi:hypothetical protein
MIIVRRAAPGNGQNRQISGYLSSSARRESLTPVTKDEYPDPAAV